MARTVTLDVELFRMPPKTEHFTMTRPELVFVDSSSLAGARMHTSLSFVHMSAAFNIRVSTRVCRSLRSGLRVLAITHVLPCRWHSSLGLFRLSLRCRLLVGRLAQSHERQCRRRYYC